MGKNPSEQSVKAEKVIVNLVVSAYRKESGSIGYHKRLVKES